MLYSPLMSQFKGACTRNVCVTSTQNYCPCPHSIQTQHRLQLHTGGKKDTRTEKPSIKSGVILNTLSLGDCLSDTPLASLLLGNELYKRLALCYTCKAARLLFVLGSVIRDYVTHDLLLCTS